MSVAASPGVALPYSMAAEQSVLGAVMLENPRWDDICRLVVRDSFFVAAHQRIFAAMSELVEQKQPIDLLTLSQHLEQSGQLPACGGLAYLAELAKNTPSAGNVIHYARYVADYRKKRQLLALAQDLSQQVAQSATPLPALLQEAEKRLFAIGQGERSSRQSPMPQLLDQFLQHLQQRCQQDGPVTGTSTGFSALDAMTCGFQPGELILLAGRPGMGKTALGLAFCQAALAQQPDKSVQIYSLEMSQSQLIARFVAMLGQVSLQRLRAGQMSDEDWRRVAQASETLLQHWQHRLLIDDCAEMTPASLASRARQQTRQYGVPALIMVDYLQLMHCPGYENRNQEIAEISRSLKALARELDCPLVALSQLNRALENRLDKRPNNGDLRDSGALEQDADLVLFIYRDALYHAEAAHSAMAEIIIGKQRNGPLGTVRVHYQGETTAFSDWAGEHHELA